ncbi:MAG TPA: hypothetical protein VFI29_03540 [Hanamia sp.]|nr:hypothetical protein [Hanamia sp.]
MLIRETCLPTKAGSLFFIIIISKQTNTTDFNFELKNIRDALIYDRASRKIIRVNSCNLSADEAG